MPQNQSEEMAKVMRGIPPSPFRKGASFGQPGEYDNPMLPVGNIEQVAAGLPRPAWSSFDANRAMKLPPLEQERIFMAERPQMLRYELPDPRLAVPQNSGGGLSAHHLEPLNMAVNQQSRQQAAMEERLLMLENRLVSSERQSNEATRAYDMQQQRVATLISDMSRAGAELSDLRLRYEGALSGSTQLQQQVMGMAADMRQQDTKVQSLNAQLTDSLRANAEMRGQMTMLADEMHRASAERAAAQTSVERLSRQFAEGAAAMMEEQRRAAGEAFVQQREESRRQQQQYMNDLAALNREVDAYRNEAQAAGGSLHSAVERLNARLQSEEAQLDRLRSDTSQAASQEAAVLGALRGQISELQNVLNGMGHQLATEQGMRRADAQAFDTNLRNMESAMQAAQDSIVTRTVTLIEGKAQGFIKAIKELEDLTADRDEETRSAGEQTMTSIVRANARKEKAALERLLVLEASLRDIANASSQSQAELQVRIDKGVTDLAVMMETARRTTEDREAALREQINAALQKVRAYARDMEEALEQERMKLEEIVKMEIKARISTSDQLKEMIGSQISNVMSEIGNMDSKLTDTAKGLRKDVDQVRKDLEEVVLKEMRRQLEDVDRKLSQEEAARKMADDQLRRWVDDNVVDQKLTEEELRVELSALSETVAAHKKLLEDELVDKVGAVRTDVDKLKSRLKAEKVEREALTELTALHSDVFVDVQKKLEGHSQKHRTHEIQLASMFEDLGDKLGTLSLDLSNSKKDHKKELETTKRQLSETITEGLAKAEEGLSLGLKALDDKMERNQLVNESIMAKQQVDTERRLDQLHEKIKEQEIMMEDEVARLEVYLGEKLDEADIKLEDSLKQLEQEVTVQLEESAQQASTLAAEQAAALARTEAGVAEQLKEAGEKIQAAEAQNQASMQLLREEMAASISASAGNMEKALDELNLTVQDSLKHVTEELTASMEAVTTNLTQSKEALDASLADLKAEVEVKIQEAAATTDARLIETETKLDATAEALASADEALSIRINNNREEVEAALAAAAEATDASLTRAAAAAEAAAAALELRIDAALASSRDAESALEARMDEALSTMRGDMATAVEELQRQMETKDNALEQQAGVDREETKSQLEALRQDVEAKLESASQELHDTSNQMRDEMTAAAEEVERKLEASASNMASQLEQQQAQVAENIQLLNNKVDETVAHVNEQLAHSSGETEAQLEEIKASMAALTKETTSRLAAAHEEMTTQMNNTTQAQDSVKAVALAQLEAMQEQVRQSLEDSQARLEANIEGLRQELQGVVAMTSSRIEELRSDTDKKVTDLAVRTEESGAALQAAVDQRLDGAKRDADAEARALSQEVENRLSEAAKTQQAAIQAIQKEARALAEGTEAKLEEAVQAQQAAVQAVLREARVAADQAASSIDELKAGQSGSDQQIQQQVARQLQEQYNRHEQATEALQHLLEQSQKVLEEKLQGVQLEIQQATDALHLSLDNVEARVRDEVATASGDAKQANDMTSRLKDQVSGLERRLSTQEASNSEYKDLMSQQLNQRLGQFASEVGGLKESVSEQTRQMTELLEQTEAAHQTAGAVGSGLDEAESELKRHAQSLAELRDDTLKIQEQLKDMAAAGSSSATVNDELEDLRSANQALSNRVGAVESKLASERVETSTQLDALKTQLQQTAVEEAKKAATAAKEEVKAERGAPVDLKAELGQALDERLPALKKELDELLEGQMKGQIKELMKGEAVADLERRMHEALDVAMATMKEVVGHDLRTEMEPMRMDVEKLKEAVRTILPTHA